MLPILGVSYVAVNLKQIVLPKSRKSNHYGGINSTISVSYVQYSIKNYNCSLELVFISHIFCSRIFQKRKHRNWNKKRNTDLFYN